jgi:hypothetical protein
LNEHENKVIASYTSGKYKDTEVKWTPETCAIADGPTDAIGDIQFLAFNKIAKVFSSVGTRSNLV